MRNDKTLCDQEHKQKSCDLVVVGLERGKDCIKVGCEAKWGFVCLNLDPRLPDVLMCFDSLRSRHNLENPK